jgi:hypothetical protein
MLEQAKRSYVTELPVLRGVLPLFGKSLVPRITAGLCAVIHRLHVATARYGHSVIGSICIFMHRRPLDERPQLPPTAYYAGALNDLSVSPAGAGAGVMSCLRRGGPWPLRC